MLFRNLLKKADNQYYFVDLFRDSIGLEWKTKKNIKLNY